MHPTPNPSRDADAPTTDADVLPTALAWLEAGHRVAIATVLETWGSAPRPVGSRLAVRDDGVFAGSVSGGCVEGDVLSEALDAIADGRRRRLAFGVADEVAWRSGLSCGGRIEILVEPIGPGGFAVADLTVMARAIEARRACLRALDLRTGATEIVLSGAIDPAHPRAVAFADAFAAGRSGRLASAPDDDLFLVVVAPPTRLVIVGAVHIAQALSPMARLVGVATTVVDPRGAFASPERFAADRLVVDWPERVLGSAVPLDPATALVALSHRPEIDDPALVAGLAAGCFHVGALGSRKTHARRIERLAAAGVGEADVARIRAPIGLDLGASGPAEIAVSILAEILRDLRRPSSSAAARRLPDG